MPKARRSPQQMNVQKLLSDKPEARDEGPRLLPPDWNEKEPQWGRRALELADIALGTKPPSHPRKKKSP